MFFARDAIGQGYLCIRVIMSYVRYNVEQELTWPLKRESSGKGWGEGVGKIALFSRPFVSLALTT